jgi:hypothetical protein
MIHFQDINSKDFVLILEKLLKKGLDCHSDPALAGQRLENEFFSEVCLDSVEAE